MHRLAECRTCYLYLQYAPYRTDGLIHRKSSNTPGKLMSMGSKSSMCTIHLHHFWRQHQFQLIHTLICTLVILTVHTADWRYASNSSYSVDFLDWANKNVLYLLYNPKNAPRLYSGSWNCGTNLDLAFVSLGQDNNWFHDRRTIEKNFRSQQRPLLITSIKMVVPVHGKSYKRRNFRKANWPAM